VNLTALVNVDEDGGQRDPSRAAVGQSRANNMDEDSQSEEGESQPNMNEDGEQRDSRGQRGSSRAAVWQSGVNHMDEDSQSEGGECQYEGEESQHGGEDSQSEGEDSQSQEEENNGEMGESQSEGENEIDQLDADDDYEAPTSTSSQLPLLCIEDGDFQPLGFSNNPRTDPCNSERGLIPSPMQVDAPEHLVSPSFP
jgi:hypothetical protein